MQGQHPLQPVLELSDTQAVGIEAAARVFFIESPAPIATAAGSTHGTPILCGDGGHFSAVAGVTESKPRAHAAAATGECEASEKNSSTFFHMSLTVTATRPEQAAADWTKRVEDSVASYVATNCEEGILVRAYHDSTLRLHVALRFTNKRLKEAFNFI